VSGPKSWKLVLEIYNLGTAIKTYKAAVHISQGIMPIDTFPFLS